MVGGGAAHCWGLDSPGAFGATKRRLET